MIVTENFIFSVRIISNYMLISDILSVNSEFSLSFNYPILYAGPQLENEIYLEYHLTSNKCISVIRWFELLY